MKNGLELKAPVTDDISRALAFAIKWVAVGVAVSPMLYEPPRVSWRVFYL